MVRALSNDPQRAAVLYREVIDKVREVYGLDEACHPLTPSRRYPRPASARFSSRLSSRTSGQSIRK